MRRIIAIVLGVAALAGCDRDADKGAADGAEIRLVANQIARVGGRSIGAEEVEALMRAEAIGAETALQELIDEELLAQEAERLGFNVGREGERTVERLMVRSMLRDLEEDNTPESISDEELREDYARFEEKFFVPERRRSWHILVKDPSEEARALATSILGELRQAEDPRAVFERYEDSAPEGSELKVLAEDLPAVTQKASLEKPYKTALFAAKSEGPLENLVETSYGWHAIVLSEILPAEQRSMADVEEESRARISQSKRLAAVVRIVQALKAEGLASYDDAGVERLLAMGGLPERQSID